MKMTITFLCLALTTSVPVHCQYSHARELGMKGSVKTITEYNFEAIKQKSSYDKAAKIPYGVTVTHFKQDGNILSRTQTYRGPNLVTDSTVRTEEFYYDEDKYIGHMQLKGKIAVFKTIRNWINDKHYIDTIISFEDAKNNMGELSYIAEFWLNDDYTPHICHSIYPKTYLSIEKEYTYTYQYPSEKTKVFARDVNGNSTAEVEDEHWEVPDETNLSITEYSYEYY